MQICKNNGLAVLALVVASGIAFRGPGAQTQLPPDQEDPIRVPMNLRLKGGTDAGFLALQPVVIALPHQTAGEKGLAFSIEISNPSDSEVNLRGLFDLLDISLRDEAGRTRLLPDVRTRLSYCCPNMASGPAAEELQKKMRKLVVPYIIDSVTIANRVLATDEWDERVFQLPPRGRMLVKLRIEKIKGLGPPAAPNEARTISNIPLPPGTYSLVVRSILRDSTGQSYLGYFLGPKLDGFKVQYRQPTVSR